MDLGFVTSEHDGATVLSVKGEIDVYTAPQLREQLESLSGGSAKVVIVDLGGVGFLDSTGLGVLVSGLKRSRGEGGDLVLVASSPRILKVLEITGLTSTFVIHATVEDALSGREKAQ